MLELPHRPANRAGSSLETVPPPGRPLGNIGATAILGRDRLFVDLSQAVSSESSHSVLVLFGFEGLKEYLEAASSTVGDALLLRLADRLAGVLGDFGHLYEPRRAELCGLFDGGLAVVRSLLVTAPVDLDDEVRSLSIRSSIGIAVLPAEATDPTYALALADHRLRALSGNLRPERAEEHGLCPVPAHLPG